MAGGADLIGEEPIPERRVIGVRVEDRVGEIRLVEQLVRDRLVAPAVVILAAELQHPARHRDGDPISSELCHERVDPFPGRFACDRYAAARRNTSFSCSNNRIRLFASRSSAFSAVDLPGLVPASTAVWESQFDNVIAWIPKSFAICSNVTPSSRFWATLTTSSRNSFGYGFGIATSFQARPKSKPDQMSPIRAADPTYDSSGSRTTTTAGTTTTRHYYDLAGQICWSTTSAMPASPSCATAPANSTAYTHDAAGRLLTETVSATDKVTYTYNNAGQLATSERVNGAATTTQTRTYGPTNLLTGLSTTQGATTTSTAIDWDPTNPVPAISAITTANSSRQIVHGPQGPAVSRAGSQSSGIGTDHYGSIVPTTPTTSLARSSSYNAFGLPASPGTSTATLGYRGELTVDSLLHLRARNYDPKTARFTTTDPIAGVSGTTTFTNEYHYANNAPLQNFDPLGLSSLSDESFDGDIMIITADSAISCGPTDCVDLLAPAGSSDHGSNYSGGCGWNPLCYGGGVIDGAWDSVWASGAGAVHIVTNPIQTAQGAWDLAFECSRNGVPLDKCMSSIYIDGVLSDCERNGIGHCAGGVLPDLIPAKGPTGVIDDIGDATRVVDDIGDAARVVDDVGDAARLSDEFADAARISDDIIASACSFHGTTEVLMANGTSKQINDIDIGDQVLATDPETGAEGARPVTKVWVHDDTLTDLSIDGGGKVTTTEDHPFWNHTDQQWQHASQLDTGDQIRSYDGQLTTIVGLDASSSRQDVAYNLTVADIHTYYVKTGDTYALVHNTCRLPLTTTEKDTLRAAARRMWEKRNGIAAGDLNPKLQVHHKVPLEWAHRFKLDPNRLSNLVGVTEQTHRRISSEWATFRKTLNGATPTQRQIIDFMREVDAKYGTEMTGI
jgi:RHS repeat-associated protein